MTGPNVPPKRAAAVNGASVQRLFLQKKQSDARQAATKMERREKAFTPGGSGSGAVGGQASLSRAGAHMRSDDASRDDGAILNTASQYAKHFEQSQNGNENSCFLLKCKKQLHEKSIAMSAKERIQFAPRMELDDAMEFRKNLYIVRHEQGLQRRRAVDPYLQLTGAQVDLHTVIPNSKVADTMYKAHHGWMINNAYRQQLTHDGVPLMTRVMRGEYYHDEAKPKAPRNDFVELNKRQIRAASAATRMIPEPGSRNHCHFPSSTRRSSAALKSSMRRAPPM
jgi:hypothetical protein